MAAIKVVARYSHEVGCDMIATRMCLYCKGWQDDCEIKPARSHCDMLANYDCDI